MSSHGETGVRTVLTGLKWYGKVLYILLIVKTYILAALRQSLALVEHFREFMITGCRIMALAEGGQGESLYHGFGLALNLLIVLIPSY